MEWVKWKVLDHRKAGRFVEMRFDEIVDMVSNNELSSSDLICPPNQKNFRMISDILTFKHALSEAEYKRRQNPTTIQNHTEIVEDIKVNKRTAFVQEEYFFSNFLKSKKIEIVKNSAHTLDKVLRRSEEVMYTFEGRSKLNIPNTWRWLFSRTIPLSCRIFLTNERIIQLSFNHDTGSFDKIKTLPWKYFTSFHLKCTSPARFNLELFLYSHIMFDWEDVSAIDKVQLEPLLNSLIPQHNSPRVSPYQLWNQNVCQLCFEPMVDMKLNNCPHCQAEFVSPTQAFYLSFILPSLGFVYCQFKKIATTLFIFELFSILFWVFIFSQLFHFMSWFAVFLFMVIVGGFYFEFHRTSAKIAKHMALEFRPMIPQFKRT